MKTPRWLSVVVGVLVALVIVQIALIQNLRSASGKTDRRIARLEKHAKEGAEASESLRKLTERVEFLEEDMFILQARNAQLAMHFKKMGIPSGDLASMEAGITDMFPGIESMVDKKLSEKLGEKSSVGRYPSMQDLSKQLGLSGFQEKEVSELINGSKTKAMEIASTPRPDGTTILDDISNALLHSDKPAQEGMKVLIRMYVEKVPGTNETYYDSLKRIQSETEGEIGTVLTEDQYGSFKGMDVNVYGVGTGYNPLLEYLGAMAAKGK